MKSISTGNDLDNNVVEIKFDSKFWQWKINKQIKNICLFSQLSILIKKIKFIGRKEVLINRA